MLRLALLVILIAVLAHAFWRLVDGVADGMSGVRSANRRPPTRGIPMARDPVCGTFVVPDRAVTLTDGSRVIHFCSTRCRDAYRAHTA